MLPAEVEHTRQMKPINEGKDKQERCEDYLYYCLKFCRTRDK